MHRKPAFCLLPAVSAILILLLLGHSAGFSERAGVPAQDVPPTIAPGERLRVSIVGLLEEGVESTFLRWVEQDGSIRLPGPGQVRIAGLTPAELEQELSRRYARRGQPAPLVIVSRLEAGEDHALRPAGGPRAVRAVVVDDLIAEPAILEQRLPEAIEVDHVGLADVLMLIGQRLEVPIDVDWVLLEFEGIAEETEVTLNIPAGATLHRALRALLDNAAAGFTELSVVAEDGWIRITTQENADRNAITVIYDLAPLLRDIVEERRRLEVMEEVTDTITGTIRPDAWAVNGGTAGSCRWLESRLIVAAPPDMHRRVAALLAALAQDQP